jgi:hypothetical protein
MQKLNLEESSSTAEEDSIRFQQSEAAKTVRYLSFLSTCLHAHVDLQNGLFLEKFPQADVALFPYEMTGTRILVAMVDAAQRMVLKV